MKNNPFETLFNVVPHYELDPKEKQVWFTSPEGFSGINFHAIRQILFVDFNYISQSMGYPNLNQEPLFATANNENEHNNKDTQKLITISIAMLDAINAIDEILRDQDQKKTELTQERIKKIRLMLTIIYQHRTGFNITNPNYEKETPTAFQIRKAYEFLATLA
jgi:hypothetical protein